ncbi:MAG TPA: hypothetical protein VHT52_17970 [Stellaceae bacterium]|jgi:hypothetical protein|nr:hypothetical protein [Stellaceae bacterium]
MKTIRQSMYDLLGAVSIPTKEFGQTRVQPWPSQRIVIDTIASGLQEDVHEFVILKSRQMAITTVASVIELLWALANPGTQGAIVADRGDNLERLRRIFASLIETLPPQWRAPEHKLTVNNRGGIAFANRSVIDLLAAGSNPDLGASRALNMMHATECSLWRSLAGVESLKASLARQNPNRLYIWESVANGFNWFYNHCQQAKVDRHMRFIFVGFWANPTYAIEKSDPDFKVYWDGGTLTMDEIERAKFVKAEYGYTIKPEQIAWWRREAEFRAEEYMLRHFPWHERECFIASGSGFFPAQRTLEIAETLASGPLYKGYRYVFEERFLSSRIEQTTNKDEVNLKVWEPPQSDAVSGGSDEQGRLLPDKPAGKYVIGIDPSGGGGGDADEHAIEVFRCYSDRLVQVAEFSSNKPLTYQLAWALSHIGGAYKDHIANLEVTGVGAAVMPEVRNLRQLAERGILQADPAKGNILDMIGNVRWFLYKRADTMGGAGSVINWKSNYDNKHMIYSELRDSLMLRRLEIRSTRLIQQMQAIVYDDGRIGAGPDTGEGDDLVSAMVLAHHAWIEWIRPGLVARNMTWASVNEGRPPGDIGTVLSYAFSQATQRMYANSRRRPERF